MTDFSDSRHQSSSVQSVLSVFYSQITMTTKKKPFNKYSLTEAYEFLHLRDPIAWDIPFEVIEPSAFFQEELRRIEVFDTESSERGKEVLIDAILQEALNRRANLKVWKEVTLKTEMFSGRTEYLFAQRFRILKHPFVCLAEAKKDDFEQGLAQCLLGMKACQLLNAKAQIAIDLHGIVTNAEVWRFYKLTLRDELYQTPFYSFQTQMPTLFGILDTIFMTCEGFIAQT